MTTRDKIEQALDRFSAATVLVVGDLMLDRYIHGTVARLSPEAPVPVVQVRKESLRPGGAANVALNIRSLGAKAVMAGLVGCDQTAADLCALLEAAGIGLAGVVAVEGVQTTSKTRVLAERQQVVRVDREHTGSIAAAAQREFLERLKGLVDDVDAVIIEDYGKGAVSQAVVDVLVERARERGTPVCLDPKQNEELVFPALTLATPNFAEACAVAGLAMKPLEDDPLSNRQLADAAAILMRKWNCELLIVTLGPQGMYLASRDRAPRVIPTQAREVFDVSGAGDTVIAAATLALIGGADQDTAAALANYAAGVVVGKLGTATCTADELRAALPRGAA